MAIMSTAFSLLFHWQAQRSISYIFSGLVVWSFIRDSAINGSQALVSAETYLKKLFVPKLFFPLVCLGTETVDFLLNLTSLMMMACLLGVHFNISIFVLPLAIAIATIYNLGMILLCSVSTVYFRDLPHILAVSYPAFFYAIPVFYPMSAIPEAYHWVFLSNPFYWFINLFRLIIHDGRFPCALEWCIPAALAIISLCVGLFALQLKERTLIYRL